jgi:NlpC/P60 family
VIARPPRRTPEGGGLAVLVVVTVLAWLAAPQAHRLRPVVDQLRRGDLPTIRLPSPPQAARGDGARAARAVAFALAQRGKAYQWGAEGPGAYDCSALTWSAWRHAGVTIPRTAAGQLAGLPRVRGRVLPGDLVVYRSDGPSRRHVAMVVDSSRMVEALARGIPVRVTGLRGGWLGAVGRRVPDDRPGCLAGAAACADRVPAGAARHRDRGVPAGAGGDRLRRRRRPGAAGPARPCSRSTGPPGAAQLRRQGRRPRRLSQLVPAGRPPLPRPVVGGAGRGRQGRVRSWPRPAARGALRMESRRRGRADAVRRRGGPGRQRLGQVPVRTASTPTTGPWRASLS